MADGICATCAAETNSHHEWRDCVYSLLERLAAERAARESAERRLADWVETFDSFVPSEAKRDVYRAIAVVDEQLAAANALVEEMRKELEQRNFLVTQRTDEYIAASNKATEMRETLERISVSLSEVATLIPNTCPNLQDHIHAVLARTPADAMERAALEPQAKEEHAS